MKKRLLKIFTTISAILTLLLPVSLFFVLQAAICTTDTILDLPSLFYFIFAWIPALLCSIAGIVFSILVKIETFYMPKLAFCVSLVCMVISGYWASQILKGFYKVIL